MFVALPVFAESSDYDIYEEPAGSSSSPIKTTTTKTTTKTSKKTTKYRTKTTTTRSSESIFDGFPKLETKILSEFYVNTLSGSGEKIQYNDNKVTSYANIESLMRLNITKNFYAESKWYLQPVNKRVYGGNYYAKNSGNVIGNSLDSDFYGKNNYVKREFQFSSYGLGVETLFLAYRDSNINIGVGKINPTFGSAFDKSRFTGVYGVKLPEQYELTEKIGGYITALFPFGNLTFNTFFDDTTGLSSTMFKNRGKDKSKGGAGNTEKLNNFSITFDAALENMNFNLGFRYLDVDLKQQEPEKGFVGGVEYLFEFPYGINFLPFAEVAYFNNFDGMKSRNVAYVTTFMPLIIENWHFIFSNTSKFDDEKHYKNYSSYLTQLSFGYKFDCGLMIDVAKIWEREVNKANNFSNVPVGEKWIVRNDSIAVMVSYLFKF